MKASVEWLKEYSDIDVDSIKLGDILTMTGSKVETIEQKGNDIKNVVVGKILEIKKQEEELKGSIDRKQNALNFADKQILDGLKTIENAKNGIENFKKKIEACRSAFT